MHFFKKLFPQSLKNIYHLAQAIVANVFYGFPSRKIKVIGITGTNGKTTTTQMVTKILEEAGKKVAMASTINFKIGDKEWVNTTKYTTTSAFAVQKFIKQAVQADCQYLVLETSSHSLDQYRVWGVHYQTAVITNVTREHLDYHKTMEAYRKAKGALFKNLKSNFQFPISNFQSISNDKIFKNEKRVSIVNLDMEDPEYFLSFDADEKYGYTTKGSKLKAQSEKLNCVNAADVELGINGSSYKIQDTDYKIQLPGLFNVENALAATCVGLSEGIELETIKEALEKIKGVSGRFESVGNEIGAQIIIDYAVTPDSLEKLYALIKQNRDAENKEGKIIAVFGSCGERDRGKRPIMGEIISKVADFLIVTNEDPYGENPVDIINEVFSGVVGFDVRGDLPNFQLPLAANESRLGQANPNFQSISNDKNSNKKIEGINAWRIMDRREAIAKALSLAGKGDFVIITGKGAEETMAIGNQRIPWNEKQVVIEELGKL